MKKQKFSGKILSLLLTFIMLVPVFPEAATAAAQVYLEDSFEDWATNQTPTDTTYSGFNTHVVESGEGSKALYMEPDEDEMTVAVSLPGVRDNFYFTVNMLVEGNVSGGRISLMDQAGASTTVINISDNALTTYNGKRGLPSLKNRFTTLTVHYKPSKKRFDVYDGENLVLEDWFVTGGPASVSTIVLTLETENHESASLYIDSVYAYSTPCDRMINFTKPSYSEIALEWEEEEYDATPKTFVYKNFDVPSGGLNGFTVYNNGGASLVENGEESYYELQNTDAEYVSDVPFAGAKTKLMFEIMVKQGTSGAELRIMYVDKPNSFDQFLVIDKSGTVIVGRSTIAGTLKKGQWNHIAIATHCGTNTLSAYLNGKKVVDTIRRATYTKSPIKIRLARTRTDEPGLIMIDSLRIYSGNTITELDDSPYTGRSILGSDSTAIKNLQGKSGFHAYSKNIAVNGVRKATDTPAFKENGIIYGAAEDFAEMLGEEIYASAGSTSVTVGGSTVTLSREAVSKDGSVYLPAKDFLVKAGKNVVEGERGLLLFADEKFKLSQSVLSEVNGYMQYTRPSPEDILEILQDVPHPRVSITPADVQRMRRDYQNDPVYRAIVEEGRQNLFFPSRTVTAESGINGFYYHNLCFLAGWLATGEQSMEDKIRNSVNIVCSLPKWAINDDSLSPATYMESVVMAYDWMYDRWTAEEKEMMEQSIIEKGLRPMEKVLKGTDSTLTNVTAMGNNINAICVSSAIMGSVAVWEKAPELASFIIAEGMRALEKVQNNFYPDGAWDEGTDYACYMITHLSHGLSTIKYALGDDFGLLTAPGMREFPMYIMSMHGNRGANNYHDASEWSAYQYADGIGLSWASRIFESPEYYQIRKKYLEISGVPKYPEDILYYNSAWENATGVNLTLDSYFGNTEIFSMRSNYEKDGVYLSAHFGRESASHSHYDGGTFVLDMLGERWAIDLGKDDYTLPGYMVTGTRDNYYRIRPEGHNTFVVNPDLSMGHSYYGFSKINKFESSAKGAVAVSDMGSVYTNTMSAKRGFMLTDNRQSVIIRDEVRTQEPAEYYWFMHTPADIEITGANTAVLTQNGKKIKISFISSAPGTTISQMSASPLPTSPNPAGQNPNDGVRKVAIHVPSSSSIDVTVKITPLEGGYANTSIPDVPLSAWEAPEN